MDAEGYKKFAVGSLLTACDDVVDAILTDAEKILDMPELASLERDMGQWTLRVWLGTHHVCDVEDCEACERWTKDGEGLYFTICKASSLEDVVPAARAVAGTWLEKARKGFVSKFGPHPSVVPPGATDVAPTPEETATAEHMAALDTFPGVSGVVADRVQRRKEGA